MGRQMERDKPVNHLEKCGERMIQNELEKLGMYVRHIDCNIDGFPDLVVIGPEVVLVEMKYMEGDRKISSVFESSQPVFYHDVQETGFFRILLCLYDGDLFYVGVLRDVLRKSMAGRRMSDLMLDEPRLTASEAAKAIAFISGRTIV